MKKYNGMEEYKRKVKEVVRKHYGREKSSEGVANTLLSPAMKYSPSNHRQSLKILAMMGKGAAGPIRKTIDEILLLDNVCIKNQGFLTK